MAEWQSIETAVFGELILATAMVPDPDAAGIPGGWADPCVIWWTEEEATNWPHDFPPTHWIRIPVPPA